MGTFKGKHDKEGFELVVTTAPIPDLNEKLNVFGRVIKGEDVVQVIIYLKHHVLDAMFFFFVDNILDFDLQKVVAYEKLELDFIAFFCCQKKDFIAFSILAI